MSTLEIILSILTACSGFGNLAQWVNLRAMRDKATYEAQDTHIESLKKVIEQQADEIKRLQERIEWSDKRQADLEEKLNRLQEKYEAVANKNKQCTHPNISPSRS